MGNNRRRVSPVPVCSLLCNVCCMLISVLSLSFTDHSIHSIHRRIEYRLHIQKPSNPLHIGIWYIAHAKMQFNSPFTIIYNLQHKNCIALQSLSAESNGRIFVKSVMFSLLMGFQVGSVQGSEIGDHSRCYYQWEQSW